MKVLFYDLEQIVVSDFQERNAAAFYVAKTKGDNLIRIPYTSNLKIVDELRELNLEEQKIDVCVLDEEYATMYTAVKNAEHDWVLEDCSTTDDQIVAELTINAEFNELVEAYIDAEQDRTRYCVIKAIHYVIDSVVETVNAANSIYKELL